MNPQAPAYPTPQKPPRKWLLVAITLAILFIGALIFGLWAYQGRQTYKNDADQQAATAVAAAEKLQAQKLRADFDQELKAPYRAYAGPSTYGSVKFDYPKTWSAYIDESSSQEPLNGFFHPDIVPGTQSGTAYALRLKILNETYADVVSNLQGQVSDGSLTAAAYMPPKMAEVPSVQPGTRFNGLLNSEAKTRGSMVVIKVRDKTLQIFTEAPNYSADFESVVLASLTFAP